MSSQQTPPVGRVVHYRSRGSADGVFPSECRAAIVTEVAIGSEVVGLMVANPTGQFFDRCVDHDPDGKPGTWHMPGEATGDEHDCFGGDD